MMINQLSKQSSTALQKFYWDIYLQEYYKQIFRRFSKLNMRFLSDMADPCLFGKSLTVTENNVVKFVGLSHHAVPKMLDLF